MRGTTINAQVTFVVEDCCNCGIAFAMTKELQTRRLEDQRSFYCPNGHSQSYTGKTEAQKLREQVERLEIQRDHARDATDRERKSHAATKGQLTKMRNRVTRGVCPADGCKRSFTDLHDHVETCHAELLHLIDQ